MQLRGSTPPSVACFNRIYSAAGIVSLNMAGFIDGAVMSLPSLTNQNVFCLRVDRLFAELVITLCFDCSQNW